MMRFLPTQLAPLSPMVTACWQPPAGPSLWSLGRSLSLLLAALVPDHTVYTHLSHPACIHPPIRPIKHQSSLQPWRRRLYVTRRCVHCAAAQNNGILTGVRISDHPHCLIHPSLIRSSIFSHHSNRSHIPNTSFFHLCDANPVTWTCGTFIPFSTKGHH